MDTQNFPRRIVLKLKVRPRELDVDLTKSLKLRWATKARNPRIPVCDVSGSDQNKPMDSEKVIVGFADDDDSGNLKRKLFDESGSLGDHKIQKTDSEGEIREPVIKIDETTDDIKNLQVVSKKVIMIDDSGNLVESTDQRINVSGSSSDDHKIQETDSDAEIKSSEIKVNDEIKNLQAPKRNYACNMCNKTFSSHQALGGHKSSHYKFTKKIYIDDLRPKKQLFISTATTCHQQIASRGERYSALIGDDTSTYYTCKICFKKFPSGQALGGHQRRHWTGNMKTQSARKILDFDLNELPKEQDEDHLIVE